MFDYGIGFAVGLICGVAFGLCMGLTMAAGRARQTIRNHLAELRRHGNVRVVDAAGVELDDATLASRLIPEGTRAPRKPPAT